GAAAGAGADATGMGERSIHPRGEPTTQQLFVARALRLPGRPPRSSTRRFITKPLAETQPKQEELPGPARPLVTIVRLGERPGTALRIRVSGVAFTPEP